MHRKNGACTDKSAKRVEATRFKSIVIELDDKAKL